MSDYYCDYGDYRPYSSLPIAAEKDADDTTDFAFNWASYLQEDTILTSEFILPDGLTEVSSSIAGTVAQIFVSGGTLGSTYRITNRIVTTGGRQKDQTIRIRIVES